MIQENKIPLTVITGNYPARWYFDSIVFEKQILKQEDAIIISTLHKNRVKTEKLIVDLRMVGWQLGEPYQLSPQRETNPWEEITKGNEIPLTFIKYFLVLNPTNKAIRDEVSKEPKSRDILMSQLNSINEDRQNKKEAISITEKRAEIEQIASTVMAFMEKKKIENA